MNNINIQKQNDYQEEIMGQTDEEDREKQGNGIRNFMDTGVRIPLKVMPLQEEGYSPFIYFFY